MRHKGFNIEESERQPGHWHAIVTHPDGTLAHNGKRVDRVEIGSYPDSKSVLEAAKLEIDFLRIKQHFER